MAVLAALLATALLTALGVSIALLGSEESMLAAHDRSARALRDAALGALHLAYADLRAQAAWTPTLRAGAPSQLAAVPGRFVDTTLRPAAPWDGSAIDLVGATDRLQASADALRSGTEGAQSWRLFVYGRLDGVAPGAGTGPWYVAVWVADDPADTDGDPSADSNGIVCLRAVALGPAEGRVAIEASVERKAVAEGPDRVRLLTVRPAS